MNEAEHPVVIALRSWGINLGPNDAERIALEHVQAWQELADILDLFVDSSDDQRLKMLPKRHESRRRVKELGYNP